MASESPPTSSFGVPSKFACVRCAERKVKCDRQRPCSACVNHKVDCIFEPQPSRPRRRHRHVKDQILTDRLKYYETLLEAQGIDPKKLPGTNHLTPEVSQSRSSSHIPSFIEMEPSGSVSKTLVIQDQGRSMFIDNSLWSRVVEEFHDPKDALEDRSNDSSNLESSDEDFSFVLNNPPKSKPRFRHPSTERIHQLWQIFVDNIDPLTKVVHVPTLQPIIQKAASNTASIPSGFNALMFAIYSMSVISLNDAKCEQRLLEPRKTLLSRYITATKKALLRARFMSTTGLVVLQALVLHILSLQEICEPRAIWSLTGVAVRVAQSMGLDIDGVILGLSPFETEIRRRIWWLLKSHDFRIAELCGLHKFRSLDIGSDSPKRPTNLNDDQLYQGMPSLPAEPSERLTDIAFVALKYEILNFAVTGVREFRQQGKSFSQFDRDLALGHDEVEMGKFLKEIEGTIETKYLRYCDPSQPLHIMTMLMARAAMNTIRFFTHHPRRWSSSEQTPLSERKLVWEISVKLLEQHVMLQSNPLLKRFAWHAGFVMQWHSFIHVLDTLRADPILADAEKVWALIGKTYQNNSAMGFDSKKLIHAAVASLCLDAYSAREAILLQHGEISSETPEFILQLRRQRDLVKAKRQAQVARSLQVDHSALNRLARAPDPNPSSSASTIDSGDTFRTTRHYQNTTSNHPSLAETGGEATGDNSFWSVDRFNDNGMGMNPDFVLTQDLNAEDIGSQNISWEQWDTWLAEYDATLPFQPRS